MLVKELPISQINPPSNAIRQSHDPDKLFELAESIRTVGLIQPIVVKPDGDRYEIIAGHRRFLASELLQALTIPAIIIDRHDSSDLAIKIHENIYRLDLTPIEEADEVTRLHEKENLPFSTIALIFKKSIPWVQQRWSMRNWPDGVREAVQAEKLTIGVARSLASIDNPAALKWHTEQAIQQGCTEDVARIWLANYRVSPWELPSEERLAELRELHKPPPIPQISCHACTICVPLDMITQAMLCPTCIALLARMSVIQTQEQEKDHNAQRGNVPDLPNTGGQNDRGDNPGQNNSSDRQRLDPTEKPA